MFLFLKTSLLSLFHAYKIGFSGLFVGNIVFAYILSLLIAYYIQRFFLCFLLDDSAYGILLLIINPKL